MYQINKSSKEGCQSLYNFRLKSDAVKRLKEIKGRCIHPIIVEAKEYFNCAYYGNMENIIKFYISKQNK